MTKNRNFGWAKGVLGYLFIFTYLGHLNSYNRIISNSLKLERLPSSCLSFV